MEEPRQPGSGRLQRMTARELPLERRNFLLMACAGALIVLGFLLMLGGSSTQESFNPDIFSFRRVALAPTVCFAGYLLMAVALFIKPKGVVGRSETEEEDPEAVTPEAVSKEAHSNA